MDLLFNHLLEVQMEDDLTSLILISKQAEF